MATAAIKPQAKPPVTGSTFHGLPPALARELEMITLTNHYPTGAVLFSEGQTARGIYVVQRGLVKVSVCASDGRTLILRIARAGAPWALHPPLAAPNMKRPRKPSSPAT